VDNKQIQNLLDSLSNQHRVAFLSGCLEHLLPICEDSVKVYKDFDEVGDAVKTGVELAWNYAVTGKINLEKRGEVDQIFTDFLDEDSPSELSYIASAVTLIMGSAKSSINAIATTLNNLEAAIEVNDEEPDLGVEEESNWQERALSQVQSYQDSLLTRGMFSELNKEKMEWVERMQNA